jgi:hypothetical protein
MEESIAFTTIHYAVDIFVIFVISRVPTHLPVFRVFRIE